MVSWFSCGCNRLSSLLVSVYLQWSLCSFMLPLEWSTFLLHVIAHLNTQFVRLSINGGDTEAVQTFLLVPSLLSYYAIYIFIITMSNNVPYFAGKRRIIREDKCLPRGYRTKHRRSRVPTLTSRTQKITDHPSLPRTSHTTADALCSES